MLWVFEEHVSFQIRRKIEVYSYYHQYPLGSLIHVTSITIKPCKIPSCWLCKIVYIHQNYHINETASLSINWYGYIDNSPLAEYQLYAFILLVKPGKEIVR